MNRAYAQDANYWQGGGRDCSEHRMTLIRLHAGFYIQILVCGLAPNTSLIACADIDAEQYD